MDLIREEMYRMSRQARARAICRAVKKENAERKKQRQLKAASKRKNR